MKKTCKAVLFICIASATSIGCKHGTNQGVIVSPSAKPTSSGPASAEQVAKEMRGNVSCPANASSQRPQGAPVDDVVGVRPGMPLDEAAHFVMCDNPLLVVTENTSRGYNIATYGHHVRQGFDARFAEPRVTKTSAQILSEMESESMRRSGNAYVAPLKAGQIRYFVSSMGMPGQEQVLSVAREEYFADGKLPTVDSIRQALTAKYGEPSNASDGGTIAYLWWEYDPSGNKIVRGSQRYGACRINASPDSGTSLSTDCGLEIGAMIQSARENPGLARSLSVTSQDSAKGYAVLKSSEEALKRVDDSRKAAELSKAAKDASAPKL
jgi:hypothetical protein